MNGDSKKQDETFGGLLESPPRRGTSANNKKSEEKPRVASQKYLKTN